MVEARNIDGSHGSSLCRNCISAAEFWKQTIIQLLHIFIPRKSTAVITRPSNVKSALRSSIMQPRKLATWTVNRATLERYGSLPFIRRRFLASSMPVRTVPRNHKCVTFPIASFPASTAFLPAMQDSDRLMAVGVGPPSANVTLSNHMQPQTFHSAQDILLTFSTPSVQMATPRHDLGSCSHHQLSGCLSGCVDLFQCITYRIIRTVLWRRPGVVAFIVLRKDHDGRLLYICRRECMASSYIQPEHERVMALQLLLSRYMLFCASSMSPDKYIRWDHSCQYFPLYLLLLPIFNSKFLCSSHRSL